MPASQQGDAPARTSNAALESEVYRICPILGSVVQVLWLPLGSLGSHRAEHFLGPDHFGGPCSGCAENFYFWKTFLLFLNFICRVIYSRLQETTSHKGYI